MPLSSGASAKLALYAGGGVAGRFNASTGNFDWTPRKTASTSSRPSGPSTWSAPSATAFW